MFHGEVRFGQAVNRRRRIIFFDSLSWGYVAPDAKAQQMLLGHEVGGSMVIVNPWQPELGLLSNLHEPSHPNDLPPWQELR